MTTVRIIGVLVSFLSLSASAASCYSTDFEVAAVGSSLPIGWISDATNAKIPPQWQLKKDPSAPSGDHVLTLVHPADRSSGFNGFFGNRFNLCWTKAILFKDGNVSVRFKMMKEFEKRESGLIWRVVDKNNYYLATYNPLDNDFRISIVKGGNRTSLADTAIELDPAQWHTMRISVNRETFAGYIDGIKRFSVKDNRFQDAGGIGMWTKNDASTIFDDFNVTTKDPAPTTH